MIIKKRKKEIQQRMLELRNLIQSSTGQALDDSIAELDSLDAELRSLGDEAEKRSKAMVKISENRGGFSAIEKPVVETEERSFGVDSAEYRSAYFKRMAGVGLNDSEKRALTTVNVSGAVPTQTLSKIETALLAGAVVYPLVSVSHIASNLTMPYKKNKFGVQRKGESEAGTTVDGANKFGKLELTAKKYIALVQMSCELEATSIDALENFIVNEVVAEMELEIDNDIINGSGDDGAKGILNTITPIETEAEGKISYKDITSLFKALPAKAKKNATLMMSTDTLYGDIANILSDTQKPIFDIDNNKVLGRPVVENDDIPAGIILFGNFALYKFNWVKDVEIAKSQESAFDSGDVTFRALALADGELPQIGGMVAIKKKVAAQG